MTSNPSISFDNASCPLPLHHDEKIVLGHGSGGKLTHDLINRVFVPHLDSLPLRASDDAAVIQLVSPTRLAISTDSHVVWPLFFPGGDIGRLAVCGTVNDVAMMGAVPLYLTAGFILEEGLEMQALERILISMQSAAAEAGIQVIAGDTKVVQKGKADGIYINTTGVGQVLPGTNIAGSNARPGDLVLLSGPVGDHGIAVLSARGELGLETDIASDIAPLNHLVAAILDARHPELAAAVHVLRDPTRGGLATTLNEIARQSQVGITIDEPRVPVRPAVAAACELLGFDPLYIANEGKLIAIVECQSAGKVLEIMKANRYGEEAVIIGEVSEAPKGKVLLRTSIGGTRILDMLASEMLPRIC